MDPIFTSSFIKKREAEVRDTRETNKERSDELENSGGLRNSGWDLSPTITRNKTVPQRTHSQSVKEGNEDLKGDLGESWCCVQTLSLWDKTSVLFLATKFMIFPYGGNEMLTVSNMKVRDVHSSVVEFLYAQNKQYRRSKMKLRQ